MLYGFKIIERKSNTLLKKGKSFQQAGVAKIFQQAQVKERQCSTGNFGDTILCPNCWTVRGASSQSILDNSCLSTVAGSEPAVLEIQARIP